MAARSVATRTRPVERRPRRWLRRLVRIVLVVLAVVVLALGVLWAVTPSSDGLPEKVASVEAEHASSAAPPDIATGKVAQALIATEDSRFYSNPGIDPISAFRSAASAITGGADNGAATLEQQLAKNLYHQGDSVGAKIDQAMIALKLDRQYSKAQIIDAYLSTVYFGHGYWGVTEAAQGYFGVAPDQLDWAQAGMLAGLVQAPSSYDPITHFALGKQRQRHVLDRLAATGVITTAQADAAFAAPLNLRSS
jgi:membrane peptidoglycan carboxypeptidase